MEINNQIKEKKILIIDFAASTGGAISVLNEYYEKAINDLDNQYIFLLNDYYFNETENVKIIILKKQKRWLRRLLFDYFSGRLLINEIKPDYIISLQNTIVRGVNVPQAVYIHQSIPFQRVKKFSFFKKKEAKLAIIQYLIGFCIKSSIKNANEIIVQTEWMKNAIIEGCNVDLSKIKIERPVINNKLIRTAKKTQYSHFFYPTSSEIYKNNEIIYQAAELLNKEGMKEFVVELTIDGESNDNIKKIGKIKRELVFKKYSESVLLFPSYIETFGLPLLEAKKCGTTIIASDTPFSHEILDDYDNAYFFNPFDAKELKEIMKKMIKR